MDCGLTRQEPRSECWRFTEARDSRGPERQKRLRPGEINWRRGRGDGKRQCDRRKRLKPLKSSGRVRSAGQRRLLFLFAFVGQAWLLLWSRSFFLDFLAAGVRLLCSLFLPPLEGPGARPFEHCPVGALPPPPAPLGNSCITPHPAR